MSTQGELFPTSPHTSHFEQKTPNMNVLPFVKWAGGKRSITPKIREHLPENIAAYQEPFVGGGAVFFALEYAIETATLADLNKELITAYNVIATDTDNLSDNHCFGRTRLLRRG